MKKVVLLADSYLPYLSGVSQSVHRFATGLTQCGAEVLVIAPDYPDSKDDQLPYRVLRVPAFSVPNYPKFRLAWPFGKKVFQAVKEFNPDVLHTHSPFQMGLAGLIIARQLRKPLAMTHHTLFLDYVHFAPKGVRVFAKLALKEYLHWFDNQMDLVITPTEPIKKYLRAQRITKPIEVLSTGVFKPERADLLNVRQKFGIPSDAFLLLYVGRLSKEKNIPFLLESIGELCRQDPKLYFLLVAGGPMRGEYERSANPQIIFAGEHSQSELPSFYTQADLFVCASKTETQGLVLIEAGMCGLPVLALGYQGVPEMVENGINGFTVPENKLEFQSQIKRLRGDAGLLARLRASSQKLVLEKFDQRMLSSKLLGLYEKLGG